MTVAGTAQPRIVPRAEHPVSRKNIPTNVLKVLYRLHRHGYLAYLVGGSVRDLILGRQPKDFDVGTDASLKEIRRLFRNSRIIGRRFKLAHIYFRDGIIEVSTFRGEPAPETQASPPDDLLVTSDNTYGTPEEDAYRRDFTVNALFYNIADYTVIDYVGGIDDLDDRLIRSIGDPNIRFREDPVRMLRACEFAGRLGFGIESVTQQAILEHRAELERASPARLTEELIQLLRCGHAGAAFQWMLDLGLVEVVMPEAHAMVTAGERGLGNFGSIPPVIDQMIAEGRELTDTGLLAALLISRILLRRFDVESFDRRPMSLSSLEGLVQENVDPFFSRFTISNQKTQQIRQALVGFQQLSEPEWSLKERHRFARKPYFDDSLLLLEILVRATGEGHEVLKEWEEIAKSRPQRKGPKPRGSQGRRRGGRRRRRKGRKRKGVPHRS